MKLPFTRSFRTLVWHSFEQSVYLILVLALAFGFSYVEDFFKYTERQPPLILGAHYAAAGALIVDLIAWGLLLIISLYKLFVGSFDEDEHENHITV